MEGLCCTFPLSLLLASIMYILYHYCTVILVFTVNLPFLKSCYVFKENRIVVYGSVT